MEIEAQIFVSAKTKYMRNIAKELSEKICSLTADVGCLRIAYGKKYIPFTISGMELMNLMQIPSLYKKDETLCARIHHLMKGQITLNDDEYAKGIYTGKLYHPVQIDRSVYCDEGSDAGYTVLFPVRPVPVNRRHRRMDQRYHQANGNG